MKTDNPYRTISAGQIAPCGINCALCMAYNRKKNPCFGCNGPDDTKPYHCRECSIVHCEHLPATKDGISVFCITCEKYPCRRIRQLDTRYRNRYGLSNMENMQMIMRDGINRFLDFEKEKWSCRSCGAILCMHRRECEQCGETNPSFIG